MRVLEIGRDDLDQAAVAVSDIRGHHDHVRYAPTARGLIARGVRKEIARATLRIHYGPKVQISAFDLTAEPQSRTRGLLTGASTAGMLAKISVEDTLAWCHELWWHKETGFLLAGTRLFVMTWSDNIITFGKNKEAAIRLMHHIEGALWAMHKLSIKAGSRELITAACRSYQPANWIDEWRNVWEHKPCIRLLGPLLHATGSPWEDIRQAFANIRKAFFKNAKLLCNTKSPLR